MTGPRVYQRILLAYDGTVKGRAALREGALLAKQVEAEVFLLSVIVEAPGTRVADAAGGTGLNQQREDYRAVLRDGEQRLRQLGFAPTAKLVIGEPAREIGAFARQIGADLVVVGHHRQSALERWWSGPNGAYLIDYVHCSLLVSQNVVSDEAFAARLSREQSAAPAQGAAGAALGSAPEQGAAPQNQTQERSSSAAEPMSNSQGTRIREPRQRLRWALYMLPVIALIVGAYWYINGGQVVSVNDAYVEADKLGVSTDVSGIVQQVAVSDNQYVTKGQLLYRLDDLPYRIALARAEAQVGIARDALDALRSNYNDARAQLKQAQYDLGYYATEFRRVQDLSKAHVASQASFDTARRNLQTARQKLVSLKQQLAAIAANLNGDPESPVEQNPRFLDALAQRDEAARELAHTIVKAPFAGIVANVPSTAPGRYLQVQATAFFLVSTNHVWVDANPKETEVTYVRPGQRAVVTVDAYPHVQWTGGVESISPAAAQEFSLLPAQNTSGNWVKVVQRIPMRVRVDTRDQRLPPLRAGMSVEVSIDTGHTRGWPRFMTGWFSHSRRDL
ncbi:MAG: hemolysin secretion protein [Gammaproteobacteria bacterium]|nr:hemolysin secretion protein [Gammaproteobacteria bacterium]